MTKRIIYGLIFGAIALGFLFLGTYGFLGLVVVIAFTVLKEVNGALKKGGIKTNPFFAYLYILSLIPTFLFFDINVAFMALGLCVSLNFMYYILTNNISKSLLYDNILFIYPCLFITFAFAILFYSKESSIGFFALLSVVVFAIFSDIFAYFVGVTLGKHKLCPKISPKKTIEGSIGAILGAIITAFALTFIYPLLPGGGEMPTMFLLVLGGLCGVMSQFGDLTASVIKRVCDIKDFGNLIPGHGGMLDRIDSIILCLPLVYMLMLVFRL